MTDIEGFKKSSGNGGKRPYNRKTPAASIRPPIDTRPEDPRPPVSQVDSVREAEEYARKLLEGGLDSIGETDEFYIDRSIIPDGWEYEYKCSSVTGQENTHHMNDLARQGWRPVPVSRHPELMPHGATGAITKKGLTLMEMPKIIVDKLKAMQVRDARQTKADSDRQLQETPANTASRDEFRPEHGRKISREMVRAVPVENN